MARYQLPRLLFLSGDELTRRITGDALGACGYEIHAVRTAEEACRILTEPDDPRAIRVLVTDADVRDAFDGLSLGVLARRIDPCVRVVYTARDPARIPEAGRVPGAPCLRTPYHAHQLIGLIEGLGAAWPDCATKTRTASQRHVA